MKPDYSRLSCKNTGCLTFDLYAMAKIPLPICVLNEEVIVWGCCGRRWIVNNPFSADGFPFLGSSGFWLPRGSLCKRSIVLTPVRMSVSMQSLKYGLGRTLG
jgi:hypothetical protein